MASRTLLIRVVAGLLALVSVIALTGCETTPSSATLRGHGFGHGRGMGQWGALGYAVDHGWSGTRILDHYYGGTTTATVTPAEDQRAYLVASKGRELIVTQTAGALRVDGYGADVAAVRVARLSSNRFRIWRGAGCAGPWSLVGDRSAGEVEVRSSIAQGDNPATMLQHCVSGATRYYRGSLRAVEALGTIVTVNQVPIESMLRSIVPKEMSPSWADVGGGRGANALRAQALAARSYALSGDTRWGSWATTCDNTMCQSYQGYGTRASGSSTIVKVEDPRTDRAVLETAHQVRRHGNGRIARTEFSTSSGGWTLGGEFPAVRDDGDAYAGNPHHSWTVTLPRERIEAAFDARQGRDMGTWTGFDGYVRDGQGDLGGRVTTVRARFTGGDVTLTGDQMRFLFGLKSSWFATSP